MIFLLETVPAGSSISNVLAGGRRGKGDGGVVGGRGWVGLGGCVERVFFGGGGYMGDAGLVT